jgi:hypothetical protein
MFMYGDLYGFRFKKILMCYKARVKISFWEKKIFKNFNFCNNRSNFYSLILFNFYLN